MKTHSWMLIAVLIALGMSSCGKVISWPKGSGYVTTPTHRPDGPHKTKSETDITVTGADGDNISIAPGGQGQVPMNGPGAKWTIACGSGKSITVRDYNRDECVLPNGITVRVDKYGQFTPIAYAP